MRRILKYTLAEPLQDVTIQEPGIVRHVAGQHGNPTIWAEVDTADIRGGRTRRFVTVATGQEFDPGDVQSVYHGTAHFDGLVFHVYELVEQAGGER